MRKNIKCIVSCINSNGESDLYFCIVTADESDIEDGEHYSVAKTQCEKEGYEAFLVYDENDSAGRAMLPLFQWDTATIIGI